MLFRSHFANASGWPDPDHYTTARDLATLAWHIINDYPEDYKYFSELEFAYGTDEKGRPIKQGNRNPLLYKNIGADGIKTGHTDAGGYGLAGTAVRDGRRVIMVLNGMASIRQRDMTDNVVTLMLDGMRGLAPLTQRLMASAAHLGESFSLSELMAVSELDEIGRAHV